MNWFSAVFIGLFILAAGLEIFHEWYRKYHCVWLLRNAEETCMAEFKNYGQFLEDHGYHILARQEKSWYGITRRHLLLITLSKLGVALLAIAMIVLALSAAALS